MTIIFLFISLLVSQVAFGQIKNYHQLTEQVFRSAAPGKNTGFLAKAGFTHVLIFKNEIKNEVELEIKDLERIGIQRQNIFTIPFAWKDMGLLEDSCDQVVMALDYLAQIETVKSNGKSKICSWIGCKYNRPARLYYRHRRNFEKLCHRPRRQTPVALRRRSQIL